jgi:hypothetical protein
MGYGIVNNDIRNTGEHTEIREERVDGDQRVYDKIDKVEDLATEIQLEQKDFRMEQRVLVQGIMDKL